MIYCVLEGFSKLFSIFLASITKFGYQNCENCYITDPIDDICKVNKYNENWKKEWFGPGIFYEGSEEVEVDVFKNLEKRKVLSNVEKAGLLSKAEELGFTLSSIEKLGVFSKAEELGLLSLLEKAAGFSPSALASAALPALVAAVAAIVLIPDDSAGLVAIKALVAAALGVGAIGLFIGSVVLGGLQEAD